MNVIVVLVDDLGWMDLSCQGSEFHRTPHIDQLASRAMRFTNGYAACAVCSPTRAAYMTGRYPARLGITDWIRATWQRGGRQVTFEDRPVGFESESKNALLCPLNPYWMDHQEVTLAEALDAAGYITGHIGKWHLGDDLWHPETQGFAHNIGGCDYGHPPSYFDPYASTDKQGRRWQIAKMEPREQGEYLTDREADEAVQFIRRHKDEPFFLSLCHYAVHTPIQAKPSLVEEYESRADPAGLQQNAKYAAMVHSVDDAMGRLLETLDALKLFDQTIVIFTSDNGGLLPVTNNHPLRNGKGSPYEGGIRVPWIVHVPGLTRPGSISTVPIVTCDIKPTVLDLLASGMSNPHPLDGVSLRTVLGGGTIADRSLFWHFPHYRKPWTPYAIVRKGSYKLLRWFEGSVYELYDLDNDLGEQVNLADSQPERVSAMSAELDAWLTGIEAKIPRANTSPTRLSVE